MAITRRDALKHGGKAIAAAAVLPFIPSIAQANAIGVPLAVVPFPVEHTDAALFDLVRQWHLADEIKEERRQAWAEAVDEHLPPEYRQCSYRAIPYPIRNTLFTAPNVKASGALCDQAEAEVREIERRIFATPARTIGGIVAKLRIGRPNLSDREQSVLADAKRLAGHGRVG